MSYTTIKAIWPGEKHENYRELRNSHGSGPVIWGDMAERHLGVDRFRVIHDHDASTRLWALWKHLGIPKHQRAVLMMTFDRAYVLKKDYARAGADLRAYLKDFPVNSEYVNHWPEIASIFESDPDVPAIGFYLTSVSDDPFQGPWNEKKEEHDAPDWDDCYDLYAELDGLQPSAAQSEQPVSPTKGD